MKQELFGVNVVGHVSGEFGIGEATRSNLKALKAVDIPFSIQDIKVECHRNLDRTFTNFSENKPFSINLVHINAITLENSLEKVGLTNIGYEYFRDRYNIGFWAWELPTFPQKMQQTMRFFDEIWTPSKFCTDAISEASPIPVVTMPHSISIPAVKMTRKDLKLPKNEFIFFYSFDFGGIVQRKNPLAIVSAFEVAFKGLKKKPQLIFKFINPPSDCLEYKQLNQIASESPDIHLIDGHLSKQEVDGLIFHCNCYISLHRSEGFGLGLAEAMCYGKPVIATGYSGNLEFMNVGNSFLIQYDLIKTKQDYYPYPKGSVWADPDLDHAAYSMRYVYDNYTQAKAIGEKAARELRSALNPQKIGIRIKERLNRIKDFKQDTSRATKLFQKSVTKQLPRFNACAWKLTTEKIYQEYVMNNKPEKKIPEIS
ncbi:MAG: glycosyltransferase [Patescibacteria group bacterium]